MFRINPTNILTNTDEMIFYDLVRDFSEIMETHIDVAIKKTADEWNIEYFHALRFTVSLYDRVFDYEIIDGFEIDRPMIRISNLSLNPRGRGLGTRIIKRFIERIRETEFGRIILLALDEDAVYFWSQMGFVKGNIYFNRQSMFIDLVKPD
ncbi:MAG: hypothetical protein ACM3MK_05770 [Chitinophagales bacterium]